MIKFKCPLKGVNNSNRKKPETKFFSGTKFNKTKRYEGLIGPKIVFPITVGSGRISRARYRAS